MWVCRSIYVSDLQICHISVSRPNSVAFRAYRVFVGSKGVYAMKITTPFTPGRVSKYDWHRNTRTRLSYWTRNELSNRRFGELRRERTMTPDRWLRATR